MASFFSLLFVIAHGICLELSSWFTRLLDIPLSQLEHVGIDFHGGDFVTTPFFQNIMQHGFSSSVIPPSIPQPTGFTTPLRGDGKHLMDWCETYGWPGPTL
jgi:hypothetical protein